MAIGTNDAVFKYGTQDEVTVASPSLVDGDGGISAAADINTWTNDDDSPMASFVVNATYAAVPDSGTLDLYCTLVDIQGTNDEPTMDTAYTGHYLGSATPDGVTSSQYLTIGPVGLPAVGSSQVYQFHIVNNQGDAAHDISAGWSMWVTPITYGPGS